MRVAAAAPQPYLYKKLNFGNDVNSIAFSADGRILYVATQRGLFAQQTRTGKTLSEFWLPRGWSKPDNIQISPDGKYLIARAIHKNYVQLFVWNLKTKRLKAVLDTVGEPMIFSPNSRWLAVAEAYDQVCLINAQEWKTSRQLEGDSGASYLDFSNDSKRLAGANFYGDAGIGDLTIWNTRTGRRVRYQDDMPMGPLYFLPGDKALAFGDAFVPVNARAKPTWAYNSLFHNRDPITRWMALRYRRNLFVVKRWTQVAASYRGKEQLELWDIVHKKRVAYWHVLSDAILEDAGSQSYVCSPDGRWLAVWPGKQGEVKLYHILSRAKAKRSLSSEAR